MTVFPPEARAMFASHYPETPHKLVHTLGAHPLMELETLARLGEALPEASIEYNAGDLPIGVDGKPAANGLTIGETIRHIADQRELGGAQEHRAAPGLCRAAGGPPGRIAPGDRSPRPGGC
jgi:hypothetical protein